MDAKTNHLTNNFAKLLHLNGHNAAINMFGVSSSCHSWISSLVEIS